MPGGACCCVSTFEGSATSIGFVWWVLVLESMDGRCSAGLSFGTLLGPEITGLLFVVVPGFVLGVVGGGWLVVSGFPAQVLRTCPRVLGVSWFCPGGCVGVCWGCWLRTA